MGQEFHGPFEEKRRWQFVDPDAAEAAIAWEKGNFYALPFRDPKPHSQQEYPETLPIFPEDYAPTAQEPPRNGKPGGTWNSKPSWDLVSWSEECFLIGDRNTGPIWEMQVFESYLAPYPLIGDAQPLYPAM